MAYSQIGIIDLIAAVKARIEADTDYVCYDAVPENAVSPFYYAEVVSKRPDNTKTMFRDIFEVWVHCIASPDPSGSSVGVYTLIQELDEAMTIDVVLPEGFWLISQTNTGLQNLQTDETNEKHALCSLEFSVSYGLKVKI